MLMPDETPVETGALQEPKAKAKVAEVRPAQLQQRLDAGLAQLNRNTAADPTRQAAAQALPVDPTVVGSIAEVPADAPRAAPAPAQIVPPAPPMELSSLVKAAPFSGSERLKQAAVNGNLAAIYEVGARLAEGRGVARDVKAAGLWLEYAAHQGFAPAQYRFGSFNREGIGMPQDAKMAFTWFQRAAEQGHILAMHNLAVLYAEGVTGSPDYASAASWFRTAAEHGVKDSQFNVAILYVRGLGVAHDMNEAYKWFSAAAGQGDPDAVKKRDEVAARLPKDKLAEAKEIAEAFRAKRPDARANEVTAPEGGWDQDAKGVRVGQGKKTRT
jgi:localization factor PodJL